MKDCRKFYIDGKWVQPTEPKDFPVVNPATEERIATISLGGRADVEKAVAAAKKAFATYSETTVEQRLALLQKIIEVYQAHYEEMATTISEEMGAPLWLARAAQAAAGLGHFFEMANVLGTRLELLEEPGHRVGPLRRRHPRPRPAIERLARRRDGAVDVGLARLRDPRDDVLGVRGDDVDGRRAGGSDPLTTDEEPAMCLHGPGSCPVRSRAVNGVPSR